MYCVPRVVCLVTPVKNQGYMYMERPMVLDLACVLGDAHAHPTHQKAKYHIDHDV